jgi:hypothetical protein
MMNKEQIKYILTLFDKYHVEEMRSETIHFEIDGFLKTIDDTKVFKYLLDLDDLYDIKSILSNFIDVKDLTNDKVQLIYDKIPEHIKDEAYVWGTNDSDVRNTIYDYIDNNLNILECIK